MSEVMQFEITSKDGVTLETEGRICEKNIRVVPRLAPLEAELGGTYRVPDGYTGYGDVTVNPKLLPLTVEMPGTYLVPEGYAGHGEVKCEPLLTNLTVTNNGTYTTPEGFAGYDEIQVEVWGIPKVNKRYTIYYVSGNTISLPDIKYEDIGFASRTDVTEQGLSIMTAGFGVGKHEAGSYPPINLLGVYTNDSDDIKESVFSHLSFHSSNFSSWGKARVLYIMTEERTIARYEFIPVQVTDSSITASYCEVEDI